MEKRTMIFKYLRWHRNTLYSRHALVIDILRAKDKRRKHKKDNLQYFFFE